MYCGTNHLEIERPKSRRKVFRIGTVRYNWPMSAHASQAFSKAYWTDSEDLPSRLSANMKKRKKKRRGDTFLPTFSRVIDFPSAAHSAIDTGPLALFWYVVLADISPFTTWLTLIDESTPRYIPTRVYSTSYISKSFTYIYDTMADIWIWLRVMQWQIFQYRLTYITERTADILLLCTSFF